MRWMSSLRTSSSRNGPLRSLRHLIRVIQTRWKWKNIKVLYMGVTILIISFITNPAVEHFPRKIQWLCSTKRMTKSWLKTKRITPSRILGPLWWRRSHRKLSMSRKKISRRRGSKRSFRLLKLIIIKARRNSRATTASREAWNNMHLKHPQTTLRSKTLSSNTSRMSLTSRVVNPPLLRMKISWNHHRLRRVSLIRTVLRSNPPILRQMRMRN